MFPKDDFVGTQSVNTKVPTGLAIFSYRYPTLSNVISFVVGAAVGVVAVFLCGP